MKYTLLLLAILLLLFASCGPGVKPENLYGKWKYIKVENPNANPPDSVSSADLAAEAPSIQFSRNNELLLTGVVKYYRVENSGRKGKTYSIPKPWQTVKQGPFRFGCRS